MHSSLHQIQLSFLRRSRCRALLPSLDLQLLGGPCFTSSPLIPDWIPYKWSTATQLYHNFQFNQGLAFYISLLVFGIWGFFWAVQGSLLCVCVRKCVCVCVCARGRVCWCASEGVWERKEACNSMSSTWTLDTVPYVIFAHLTCQRADVWLVWRTNMCSKCVSVMLTVTWPRRVFMCMCRGMFYSEYAQCAAPLAARGGPEATHAENKRNREECRCRIRSRAGRKQKKRWRGGGGWGREQKECIGQAHRVSTKRCKDLSLLVTALTARRLERNALVIQAPRIGSAPLPLPPCAPPLYRQEHCSGDSFVPLDFWRSPFRTSTETPCAVRP